MMGRNVYLTRLSLVGLKMEVSRNMIIFYGEELLAAHPIPKAGGLPLSAVRDSLFNIFAATLHMWRSFLHPQHEEAP